MRCLSPASPVRPFLFAIFLAISLSALRQPASAQPSPAVPEWAWMGGSNLAEQPGVYGTEYQFDAANIPGARYNAISWVDQTGKLWLFGGIGASETFNDLWEFDPAIGPHGEWAWMGGGDPANGNGVPGTEYQFDPSNIPSARLASATWVDHAGRLWLFGGLGFFAGSNFGALEDLWVFDPARGAHGEWAWMGGNLTPPCAFAVCGGPGAYGPRYQFNATNSPGSRDFGNSWTDSSGRFWLFGGAGYDSAGSSGNLNDLWVFDPALGPHGEWAWMGGSGLANHGGGWGARYAFDPANLPPGREWAASWLDRKGRFWVFGGFSSNPCCGPINDLWVFDPALGAHGEWAWVAGVDGVDQPDSFVAEYRFDPGNSPGGRESPSAWIDPAGRLWLFGGYGYIITGIGGLYDDVWVFDPGLGTLGEWAWMGPTTAFSQPRAYGNEYSFARSNAPGSRDSSVIFTDSIGRLWLFGGYGYVSGGSFTAGIPLNDLWELLVPDQAAAPVFSPAPGTYPGPRQITITDATPGAIIYYTLDGTAPSIRSTPYAGPVTIAETESLSAIAIAHGYVESSVASGKYTILRATCCPPIVSRPVQLPH